MYMPVQIKCDKCGKVISELQMIKISKKLIHFGEPHETHLCSWNCVKELAEEMLKIFGKED